MKDLCSKYGFNGLYPLDNEAPRSLAGSELALWIYRANIALIQKADLVAANMNAFRGAEPDSGTAFEVGYAVALGKPVWAYTDDSRPRVQQIPAIRQPGGRSGEHKSEPQSLMRTTYAVFCLKQKKAP